MKVLVIGGGGREHAMAWKVAQSPKVSQVFVAPGNAGTANESKITNIAIGDSDLDALLDFAKQERIELTIVGPETPLVLGVVDRFRTEGLAIFGPSAQAAQLEGSKAFSKEFLFRHKIPTAAYQTFSEPMAAKTFCDTLGYPCVIKADGLAAGKGVIIAHNQGEAYQAIEEMLCQHRFANAGARVVIEEFLTGEEASFIVMTDGHTVLPLASSQDHKALGDGDTGPNTGGMGACSPAAIVTDSLHDTIMEQVIWPTIRGMAADGIPYSGFLYAGLMIDDRGAFKVLEFNCRLGDPETQPLMMRMESDLGQLCHAASQQQLAHCTMRFDPRPALGVVMASGGYPENYQKGHPIDGLDSQADDVKVFHAGTCQPGNAVLTSGGRVLCVTALGENMQEAQQRAYRSVAKIGWPNVCYRKDIGYRNIPTSICQ